MTIFQSIASFDPTRNFSQVISGAGSLPRIPAQEASIISLHSNGFHIAERFVSLLTGRPLGLLHTPVGLFGQIPFVHLQMNGGLIQFLRGRTPWGALTSSLSLEYFARLPLFQRLFQNWARNTKIETNFSSPSTSQAAPFTTNNPPAENTDQAFLTEANQELQNKIYTLEPKLQDRLNKVNEKRAKEGKAPVDFQKTTQEIESIMNNPSLSDKDKKNKVEEIRKRLGLGKGDMKALFTKRLAKIYREAANKIKDHIKNLEAAVKQAEKTYGKDSPEAATARNRLESARQTLEPTLQKYEQQAKLYNSMYPSFWSKLGGFFKKIGKGLLKVGKVFSKIMNFVTPFLRFIPGIGQMVAFGWGALKGLVQAFRGNFKGFLGSLLNGVLKIPGVDALASTVSNVVSQARPFLQGITSAVQGNFSSLLQLGSAALARIPGVGPTLSRTAEYLLNLISPQRRVEDPLNQGVPPGAIG